MTLWRRAPCIHPLAPVFDAAVDSLGVALAPQSARQYRGAARNFLLWLGAHYPEVVSLAQLRRDPHILGWMAGLRSRLPPLAPVTYILRLTFLRGILNELAWTAHLPALAHLLRREDVPRRPHSLPRALSAEHDHLLQQALRRRNDLGANFFLLLRHTGMRIGEAVDLSFDCLHTSVPDHWAIHVPLGKLKSERMVPVDSFTRDLVHRLRFFRSLDPSPPDGHLLARPVSREMLIRQLRTYLHEVSAAAGIPGCIVPHQLRHYLPFRTMSSSRRALTKLGRNSRGSAQSPRLSPNIVGCRLQTVQEREDSVAGSIPAGLCIRRGCPRKCFLFHGECRLEVNLCGFHAFVAEPQRDYRAVDACL